MTDCVTCDYPVADTGLVCHPCTSHLRDLLREIADNAGELDPVLARQTSHGDGTGRPSAETPLPVHVGALEARDTLRTILTGWTMVAHEERGGPLPVDTIPALARHLATQLDWFRHRSYAADVWSEITRCHTALHRAIDSPPSLTYLGPCAAVTEHGPCSADIRAVVGSTRVTCPACRTVHDVEERRAANVATCRDLLVPRLIIPALLDRWGYPVPLQTIDTWIARGQLPRRGDRYRVGDALDRAIQWAARRSTKAA